ncbi:MAG TPA: HAD-IB family hydrolase [Caulobacteraceae bacterium]|jgi:phosphatidylglycerophosphatase C
MGLIDAPDQGPAPYRPLVAFDFDGTLTWRDSFLAFLAWRFGTARFGLGMARLAGPALAYARHRDRERLKAATVREFLRGQARADLIAQADAFAASHARRLFRPDAIRCWKQWQKQGARLTVVTASPEILVAPFARGLGAESVIGTRLGFSADDIATGDLDGPNCRGPEKVARLRAAFGDEVRLDAAYGDSDGDKQMLALADEPGMKLFSGRP